MEIPETYFGLRYVNLPSGFMAVEALDKPAEQMANPRKNILGLDAMTMMLGSDLFNKSEPAAKKTPIYEKPKVKSDDDILNDFLNKICH